MEWISPDNRVKKSIIERGTDERKPSFFSECRIEIFSDNSELLQFNDRLLIIGDNCNTDYGRLLDNVLQFISPLEVANITFDDSVSFKLKLLSCDHKGYIFEWDSAQKLQYSEIIKEKGVASYKDGAFFAAAHRFSLALKLLHSIPIDVSNIPESIDGVLLEVINAVKVKLYDNLAMCESKLLVKDNQKIRSLCNKALELNENDVKALNRLGSICQCQGDIDGAFVYYSKLATVEPNNSVAKLKLNEVALLRSRENKKVDDIYKKMFNK